MPAPRNRALSFSELSDLVAKSPQLNARQRIEARSAIQTFLRVVGRAASDVVVDPAVVRPMAAKAPWKLAGLSKRTWANTMSRLGKAMEVGGVRVHRQRRNYKVSGAWDLLLWPLSRRDRDELHRFAGWCSVQGIEPPDVSEDVLRSYLKYLEDQCLRQSPRERCNVTRRAWNRAIALPNSAYAQLTKPVSVQRALRWSDFPENLQQEVAVYEATSARENLFDPARKPLKPTTLRGYMNQLRWYASSLVECGRSSEALVDLKCLVAPELVKQGLTARLGQRQLTDSTRPGLHAMATAILNVAGYVRVPEAQLSELRQIAKKVEHRPRGMCSKNKERLAPLRSSDIRRQLLRLPLDVADRLAAITSPTPHQALLFQSACLLEILLHVPMRIKNAAGLALGVTIARPVAKAGRWRISIPAADVKNFVPLDAELGVETGGVLDRYVGVFRPVLMGEATAALFVSMGAGAKDVRRLSEQLTRFIHSETGLTMHAHLFRHFSAFQYLEENPGDYETVRRILGHRQIATTVSFYAGLETDRAFATYDSLIARNRIAKPNAFKEL